MRLIDATKAIESIDEIVCSMSICINSDYCNGMRTMKDMALHAIEKQPTVNAVPVYMVKQMRDAQKRYFRTRDADALQESKQLERDIDRLISNDGIVQGRLF